MQVFYKNLLKDDLYMLLAVLGDSLTYGFPFGPEVSWLNILTKNLNIPSLNCGVCGETTSDMHLRLKGVLKNEQLTHIIIFGGANDLILDKRPVRYIVEELCQMQKKALEYKVKVGCVLPLLTGIESYKEKFLSLRKELQIASSSEVFLIDFQSALKKEENSVNYLSDGVHLSIKGNEKIGEYASVSLRSWLLE